MCSIADSVHQLELYCPSCQQCQICYVDFKREGSPSSLWPDAPRGINFYELKETQREGVLPYPLDPESPSDCLTQCPACKLIFDLKAGQEKPPGPVPFALTQILNWEETYRALETQRFRKKDEFRIRMRLWRLANDERRVHQKFRHELQSSMKLFFALLGCLLTHWHLGLAVIMGLGGFCIGTLTGQGWTESAAIAAGFASFYSALIITISFALVCLTTLVNLIVHRRAFRANRKWRQEGSLYRKNLITLLPFLNENNVVERLVKAEGHRQLGQFDQALALIEQGLSKSLSHYSHSLKSLCLSKNDQFFYSESFSDSEEASVGVNCEGANE